MSQPRDTPVVVLGPVPPPVHGAARVTGQIRDALAARPGVRLVVVDTSPSEGGGPLGAPARLVRMLAGLARVAFAGPGGALYVGGAGGVTLWYQSLALAVGRAVGLRLVMHHHSWAYLHEERRVMRVLTRVAGPRARHVVLCEGMGERLRRRYPGVRDVAVCSNAGLMAGLEERGDSPEVVDQQRPIVLGHLSNLSLDKGLAEVLETARSVRAAGRDVQVLLAGPVADAAAESVLASARTDLGGALLELGRIAPEDVDFFYRQVDVFCFPSRYVHEAEPLVVLDAARNGVPSVTSATGCLPGMVPVGHAIADGVDYPSALLRLLQSGRLAGADAVREGFAARRAAALAAHVGLIDHLVGGGSEGR